MLRYIYLEEKEIKMQIRRICSFTMIITLLLSLAISWAESLEDKAITLVKNIDAVELDSELPKQPFAIWFGKIVGANAQTLWETNDCGEQSGTSADIGRDFPLCVEVDATLSDGRQVGIMIAVGTFEKGVGKPQVFWAFIKQKEHLYDVPRLRELQKMIWNSTEK